MTKAIQTRDFAAELMSDVMRIQESEGMCEASNKLLLEIAQIHIEASQLVDAQTIPLDGCKQG